MTDRAEPLRVEVKPELQNLRLMRRAVRDGLGERGVTAATTEMALLVLDEVVSNSIEHGIAYRTTFPPLVVRLVVDAADVLVDYVDPEVPGAIVDGLAAALTASRGGDVPPPESERGRGLYLVATLLTDLTIEHASGGGLHLHGRLLGDGP